MDMTNDTDDDGTASNSTDTPPFPAYLLNLQFAQNWITLIAYFITLSTMSLLLVATRKGWKIVRIQQLSPGLRLFFNANIIYATLSCPYQIYRIALWTPPSQLSASNKWGNLYNPDLLFWLSAPELVAYGSIPSTILLLTLERCLILKFPFSWLNKNFPVIAICCFLGIVLFNLIGHLIELPLDQTIVSICHTASCTTSKNRLYYQIASKITLCGADVIASVIFLFLLHETSEAAKKLSNRVILYTLLIEFCLGIVPTLIFVVLNKFTNAYIGGVPNGGEKGELVIMFTALDTSACGILYWVLLYRKGANKAVTSVLHAGPMTIQQHANAQNAPINIVKPNGQQQQQAQMIKMLNHHYSNNRARTTPAAR